VYLYPLSIQR